MPRWWNWQTRGTQNPVGFKTREGSTPSLGTTEKNRTCDFFDWNWYILDMEKEAREIVKKLQQAGFTAYFAGGAVRDMLLSKDPEDIDIATSARPEQVEALFEKTISVGRAFGVISVIEQGKTYEVATFRREAEYFDSRRPTSVHFTDAREDANRRDFTINGLFYDPVFGKTIDFVGGVDDIKRKTIRFIGNAFERINEDHLRLVRAIRFKVTLGFQYAPETFQSVRKNAALIRDVSVERVKDELDKIMASENRALGLIELSESELLKYIIPEIEEMKSVAQPEVYHKEGDVFVHTYLALKSLPPQTPVHICWAVLLHDIAKPSTMIREDGRIIFHDHAKESAKLAQTILKRLKFPNFTISSICWLIHNHMKIGQIQKMRPNKRLEFVLDPKFPDLIELARADSKGTYPINLSLVSELERYVREANDYIKRKKHIKKSQIICGDDLIRLGLKPSSEFKKILEDIHDKIVDGEISTKKSAIKYVEDKYLQ